MLRKNLAALAAISMMMASTAAGAQSAQSLSLANSPTVQRAGAETEDASNLTMTTIIIGAVVIGLLIWGGIELLGDNETDAPTSP